VTGNRHPLLANTEYINTIPVEQQPKYPGDPDMEIKLHSYIRWNAMAMVVRANKDTNVGGHIASFASAAALYDVGFSHFWRAPSDHDNGGDLIFFQGHSVPGVYARAFMLGRLTEEQMDNFRQEVDGKGISSYPHPWLMPDFWQFPTVSMGLGPLCAIYSGALHEVPGQPRLIDAAKAEQRKVWAFLGDGETDEVESLGAIGMAGREKLDNLVFVINCNLQRLDGPVRGNGKIIQELEAEFRGAGWNVIKLIWGTHWDALFARDKKGILKKRMMELVRRRVSDLQGQERRLRARALLQHARAARAGGRLDRRRGVEPQPRRPRPVQDLHRLQRAPSSTRAQPTLILAKTIKGFGMGQAGEAMNISHQQKKMDIDSIRRFRDRFGLPVPDDKLAELPYLKLPEDSPEYKYMMQRRMDLGGFLPSAAARPRRWPVPALDTFAALLKASGEGRELSTTMAIVRIMNMLLKDKQIGKNIVPIVPDESRTFGMEGMFRQYGIWNQEGQKYVPEDHDQLMFYKEAKTGQVLQEGINEAGAMADWIAAGTAYSVHGVQMIPFYIFYSMFGLQRTMDLCWAAADQRTRGFLIGGTAGRTTLNGEGLQHEDGHSLILANMIPNCISYDPTFQYEVAVVVQDGMRRMFAEQEDVYYYLTVMNENYEHPEMPRAPKPTSSRACTPSVRALSLTARRPHRACSCWARAPSSAKSSPPPTCSRTTGVSMPTSGAARASTSWRATARTRALEPAAPARSPACRTSSRSSNGAVGPVIAATDYIRLFSEQIRPSSRTPTSRWAPTVSAVRTPAKSCVTSSKWIATGSRWPPSRRWPTKALIARQGCRRPGQVQA
jgi:pyruvate dehydrogenase E1 component